MKTSHPIRILVLESDSSLSTPAQEILQAQAALRIFDVVVVSNLRELFREIDDHDADVILIDLDPAADPELVGLSRLHEAVLETPVVALLADKNQKHALSVLE